MAQKHRQLTDLEGAVLGLVWERGPCTGYTVRKVFLESANFHWTASRGAIYPALERLAKQRLLTRRKQATGQRTAYRFAITPRGLSGLRNWVDQPTNPAVVSAPPDPLRTRLPFLSALTPSRRERVLIELRENMSDELSNFSAGGDADDRLSESTINRRLAQGVRLALAARLEWLDHILSSAGEAGSPNPRGKKR